MLHKPIYYLDTRGGLWKKEGNDYYFFSQEKLEWIKNHLFYLWQNHRDFKIKKSDAEKYISKCHENGSLKKEKETYRYWDAGEEYPVIFAVDKNGNEYVVHDDLTLSPAENGTISSEYLPITELDVKEEFKGTIFKITNSYTSMDEDYFYEFIVFGDGSLYINQMESYCYERTYTLVEKESSEELKNKICSMLKEYEKEIENMTDCYDDLYDSDCSIFDNIFACYKVPENPFIKEIMKKLKTIIDETYPNEINWDISINGDGYIN